MTEKALSEFECPLCKKTFRVRKGKPRTLKQWRASLMVHLVTSLHHHLGTEEAQNIVNSYLKKIDV